MKSTCYVCDGPLEIVREERPFKIGSREALVPQEFERCAECGEEFFSPDQADRAQSAAAEKIRDTEGLLQPREIRAIREGLGLSQADFERLLGVGPKTVVRWERGTVFQGAAVNVLLELVREVPGVAESLANKHKVMLRTPRFVYAAGPPSAWSWLEVHQAHAEYKVQRREPVHLDDHFVRQKFSGIRIMRLGFERSGGELAVSPDLFIGALGTTDSFEEVG